MLSKGEITAACITGVVLGGLAGGCVVVIDGKGENWSWSDDKPKRPKMGVYLAEPGYTLASQLNIDRREATVITGIVDDSPAERAGLQQYDIVTAIEGIPEADPSDLRRAIRSRTWGDSVALTVMREGHPLDIIVTFDSLEPRESPKY